MKVFVFDLDGTLVNSVEIHAKAFKDAVKKLGFKNYNKLYKEFKKYVGLPLEKILENILPNLDKSSIEKIKKLKEYYFLKNIDKVKPIKKAIEFLKEIKEKGYKTAIFSSSPKKIVKKLLKKFKLEKYFDYIVSKEDVKKGKPNPEGLIKIMKKFKTKELIFIGDSKYDKLACKALKCKFIHISKIDKFKI
ncbi:MAG: HAD-IA family hydrolase [Candidatus Aenigmatarchaeota archaeon]